MISKTEEKRGLSVREAALRAGVSKATAYRLIARGKLRSVKILNRRIVTPEAIDALLDEGA